MKKSMLVVLFIMLMALFSLPGKALADSDDPRSFVLSNELGSAYYEGGLIDQLIAAGHGDDNLYEVLQLLAADTASGIPQDFVDSVGNNDFGSEVFTETLSSIRPGGGPFSIGADGHIYVAPIYGKDYSGEGYTTGVGAIQGVAKINYTLADDPDHYILVGTDDQHKTIRAIGIAWAGASTPASIPTLNEWGLILLSLVLAGAGVVYMKRRRQDAL